MEQEFIFKLKRALVIPINEFANEGVIVYNSREFALGYSVIPNPKEKELSVSLIIYRIADERLIRNLATYRITEQGFPTGEIVNAVEIEDANKAYIKALGFVNATTATLTALYVLEAQASAELEDTSAIVAQIQIAQQELEQYKSDLKSIVIPAPELAYWNKYSDIIDYFNKDGSITEEGLAWAKSVPFLGLTLNDYLA